MNHESKSSYFFGFRGAEVVNMKAPLGSHFVGYREIV